MMSMRQLRCYFGWSGMGGEFDGARDGLGRSMIAISIVTGTAVWALAIWKVVDLIGWGA